ncbi:MAG: hypothetical protein ACOC3Z_00400, partial [Nanoarchaeota archaeon]
MEKRGIFIFIFIILLLGIVSSECVIKEKDDCPDYQKVIGVSNEDGGHGENYSQENYDYYLCCDNFLGPNRENVSNVNNLVLKLSDVTNAHAELSSQNNYDNEVFYGYVDCINQEGDCPEGYTGVASLSSETNAHIGEYKTYTDNICCKDEMKPIVNWIDDSGNIYDKDAEIEVMSGVEGVGILAQNLTSLSPGESIYFQIYKKRLLIDDNLVKELKGEVDSNYESDVYWYVNKSESTNIDDGTYYAKILEGNKSNEIDLIINDYDDSYCDIEEIVSCSSYTNEGRGVCESDTCSVAEKSIESSEGKDGFCSETWTDDDNEECFLTRTCGCYWNSTTEKCASKSEVKTSEGCDDNIPNNIGKCVYEEETEDDCSDGFLFYSWREVWNWGVDNTGESEPGEDEDKWVEENGKYYYDPHEFSLDCEGE